MDGIIDDPKWTKTLLPAKQRFPVKVPEKQLHTIVKVNQMNDYNPAVHHRVIARRRFMLEAERKAANERSWGPVDGCMFNRFEMMELLLSIVSGGLSLNKALKNMESKTSVTPDLSMVRGWCRYHPDFGHAMAQAEEIRGEILGSESLQDLLDADGETLSRESLALLKMQSDAKAKAAARMNAAFQDKSVVEHRDPNENASLEDMEKRLANLLRAHPAIAKGLAGQLNTVEARVE